MKSRRVWLAAASVVLSLFYTPSFAQKGNWYLNYVQAQYSTPNLTIGWACVYKKTGGKGKNFNGFTRLTMELPANITGHARVKQECAARFGERRAGMGKQLPVTRY